MLQPASLAVPKTGGRSRFSKALPAVPPIDTSPSPTTTSFPPTVSPPVTAPPVSNSTSKALPTPKVEADLPPPPPPLHNDDPRVPVQFTPLPPIPRKKPVGAAAAPTTPTSAIGTPKMVIPRRPVGTKQQQQKPLPPPQQSEAKLESQSTSVPVAAGPQQSKAQPQSQESQQQERNSQQEQRASADNKLKQEQKQVSGDIKVESETQAPPVPPKSGSRLPESTTASTSNSNTLLSPPQQSHETFDSQYQLPLKSPSESLSSILSAYSRSSTASVVRSSDGTAYSAVEPHAHNEHDKSESQIASSASNHEVKESVSTIADSFPPPPPRKSPADGKQTSASSTPPPPPSKDNASQAERPSTPPKPLQVGPELGAPSPPRQQIWRRRSIKGSRELPDLRLDYSHGSTASTSTISTITQKPLPIPKPSPIEGSPADPGSGSAQGKREAAPEPPAKEGPTMGSGSSKIDRLKKKFHVSHRSDDTTKSSKSNGSAPVVNRPPTPEYQREEEKTPVINSFVSPVSPASSPEIHQGASSNISKDLPQQPPVETAKIQAKPPSRKAVPAPNLPALQPTKSMPDLKKKGPSPTHEPMPPMSAQPPSGRNSPAPGPHPSSGRNSPAPCPHPPRGRQPGRPSGPPGAYPPSSRASSARPSSRGSVRPGPRPRAPEEDRWTRSPTGGMCYRGRDGTLYPEMKAGEPDPKALNFPLASAEIPEDGTVFKPVTIKQSHYNCYHRHKSMLRRANRRYPLACQVCDKGDTDDRFACTFCHLRLCEPCLKAFDTKGRDLHALMQDPPVSGTLSLSSPTRPGTALGLQVTT